ncbi:hypothetical protein CDIK_3829, partial [Cucumispora dikerogammari]
YSSVTPSPFAPVKTIIDFNNSPFIESHKISKDKIIKNIRILSLDIIKNKYNIFVVSRHSEAKEVELTYLKKDCYKNENTNSFVILLSSTNDKVKNPLIKYLEEHPLKAFQLYFRILGPGFNYLNPILLLIVEKIKQRTQPLNDFEEDQISNATVVVKESLTWRRNLQAQDMLLNSSDTYYGPNNIDLDFNAVHQLSSISKKLRENIIKYLKISNNLFNTIITVGECCDKEKKTDKKIMKLLEKMRNIYYNVRQQIREFLNKIIKSEIKNANISEWEKDILSNIFEEEIDSHTERDLCVLSRIFDNIDKKKKESSKILAFWTAILRFNHETGRLEEVIYEQNEYNTYLM